MQQVQALERIDTAIASLDTVVTRRTFAAPIDRVWDTLMFYEQVETPPPFYLRWLLPVPVRTIGRKSEVGDEALCVYETGHLVKQVTQVDAGRRYAFSVIEQKLDVGGGMRLSGGSYELRTLGDGSTEIVATTHYTSERAPRWLWRPIEAKVCHLFHGFILRVMRAKAEAK